ncbi:MAG: SMC-Scp complex subunit ScpB [Promethearchaeota archaeon]
MELMNDTMDGTPGKLPLEETSINSGVEEIEEELKDGNVYCEESLRLDSDALSGKDEEILCNLVEGALFMKGKMIAVSELSSGLGIPPEPIQGALLQLKENYKDHGGAMQVRNVYDDYWVLELREVYTGHVDEFYIEDKPYTRSEIMTLSFVAFMQPVPKKILKFYRGNNAISHVKKFVRAGFLREITLNRGDGQLVGIIDQYERERAERMADLGEEMEGADMVPECETGTNGQQPSTIPFKNKKVRKKRVPKPTDLLECYISTRKFSGYFNLPGDVDAMKLELEEWQDICSMFDS